MFLNEFLSEHKSFLLLVKEKMDPFRLKASSSAGFHHTYELGLGHFGHNKIH